MVLTLLAERKHEQQRAEEQLRRAEEQAQRAEELQVELLRLQLELERFKKWYYGPRADRLQSTDALSQLLLDFAEQLDHKPIHPLQTQKSMNSLTPAPCAPGLSSVGMMSSDRRSTIAYSS